MLLLIRDIAEVNRMNTLYYVPNALSVVMGDSSEYFFGSFIDREQCYAMLISLNDVGKHMATLPGYDETAELRSLEFGYQTRNNFFGGGADEPEVALVDGDSQQFTTGSPEAPESQRSTTPVKSSTPVAAPVPASAETTPVRSTRADSGSQQSTPQLQTPPPKSAAQSAPAPAVASPAVVAPAPAPAAPVVVQAPPRPVEHVHVHVDENDGIKLNTLFERSNISLMQEKVLPFPASKLWKTCWLHGKGYG